MRRTLLFCCLALTAGCSRDVASERPTIVVVSVDTLRSDRLPAYGHAGGSTPAVDALVRDGVLFERAFAEVPLTLPSHASLFTGEIPPRHGVRDNLGFEVDPGRAPLLAARLRDAGYATFGAVSSVVLRRATGIAHGFDGWDEPAGVAAERSGRAAIDAAKRWLADGDPRPRFLFVHLYEPHAPYAPPEPFRSRHADPYDGEIAAADALLGELVAELRSRALYDDALIVLLSDHGEGLGDHGEDEHGLLLYREALQVPLIVKLPRGERAGERVRRNVGLIDVVPTLLERLRLDPGAPLPGLSLLAHATGAAPADRTLYAETFYPLIHFGWSDLASAISGDLHLVSGRRDELFDLARDPGETVDRLADERRGAAALRRFLDGIDRTLAPPAPADAETVAKLGALGYLGGAALPADPADRNDLPDPRDEVRAAMPKLRELRADGDTPERLRDAALRMLELGRHAAALELLEAGLPAHPRSAELLVLYSRALLQSGRTEDARRAADSALALDPELADAFYQRAVVAMSRRDGSAAIADLEQACALDARHVEARKALAMLRYAQGDAAEAKRRLEEVLAIDPGDADARADLAQLAQSTPRGGA